MTDLIACPRCERNNGLRRTTCLYCGAELPVTAESAGQQVPILRPVEEWERGFTVVLAPLDEEAPTARQLARLSEIARVDEGAARAFLDARTSLPLVRVATEGEADIVARLLGASDLGATVVADAELTLDRQTRRVRELRLGPTALEAHVLWGEWEAVPRDEIALAVEGRVVGSTVEIVEGTGRKRGSEIEDTSEYFAENYVVDIYGASLEHSFRVKADSFDFSCLGAQPALRLDENVSALAALLASYLGASRYDASYSRVARLLANAWPIESRVRSYGLSPRGDFRKYTKSFVTKDALTHFTRYSRMR
jgi:hypothetical protein